MICATHTQREPRSNQSVSQSISQSVNPTHSGQADRKREQGGHENTKTSERRRTLRVRLVCMEPSLMASQTVRNSCERTAPGARRLYILTGCAPACRQSIPPFSHDRCRHMWHWHTGHATRQAVRSVSTHRSVHWLDLGHGMLVALDTNLRSTDVRRGTCRPFCGGHALGRRETVVRAWKRRRGGSARRAWHARGLGRTA